MTQKNMLYDYKVKRTLEQHHIEIADQFHRRQYAIKIRNFHFSVLSSKVFSPQELMSISNSFQWSELTPDNQFFMKDEMINLGIQCLYLLRISLGEIVIQRSMTKELTVSSVRSLTLTDLTPREGKLIEVVKEQQACDQLTITFGSDLEFMLYNKRTKRYINAHRLAQAQQGDTFGIDQAIAIHNLQVYHPIIEVRPKPAVSMEQLFMNLLSQYKQLTKYIGKHSDYVLITKPNINDRFNLGGHIHFGNIPFTFQQVRLLDQLVMIPFSVVEDHSALNRRKKYGRLGSVRENRFLGFEYRSFSSWVHLIPRMFPILNWIEYILKHSSDIKIPELDEFEVFTYYYGTTDVLNFFNDWFKKYSPFIAEGGSPFIDQFINAIKNIDKNK